MDSDTQIDTNPVGSCSTTHTDVDNKSQNSGESSEQRNVIDVIGNGQLVKKTIKAGDDGIQPQRGNICKINLVGKLEDGTIVEEHKEYAVQVGDVEVVQGVDMSIPLMTIGEIAEISVDSRFAYGAQGLTNDKDAAKSIPPNAKVHSPILKVFEKEKPLSNMLLRLSNNIFDSSRNCNCFKSNDTNLILADNLYRGIA